MNIKDNTDSDILEVTPSPKWRAKEDPDWKDPNLKPKTRLRIKSKSNANSQSPAQNRSKKQKFKKELKEKKVSQPLKRPTGRAKSTLSPQRKITRKKLVKNEAEEDKSKVVKYKKRKSEEIEEDKREFKKFKSKAENVEDETNLCQPSRSASHDRCAEAAIVARNMLCSVGKAQNLIDALCDGATLPFLIRYRKNLIGDWSPADMRKFKEHYQNAKEVVTRAAFIKKKISAIGHLNSRLIGRIDGASTIAELDDIYEPYKPAKAASKLALVRDLKLEHIADEILNKVTVDLYRLINVNNEHIKNLESVKELLSAAIVESMIQKLKDDNRLCKIDNWMMTSSKITKGKVEDDKENFKKYYDFKKPIKFVRPDETLALNRGSKKKIIKVSFIPRDHLKEDVRCAIVKAFQLNWIPQNDVGDVLNKSITTAVDKMLTKLSKKIRSDITKSAEVTAIEVFSMNLKRLLLTPPYRTDREFHVLGIDPGKRNGCKTVIVNSLSLEVEDNEIIYLCPAKKGVRDDSYEFESKLKKILRKWGVEIVVIGNGVGCQDVENIVNHLVRSPEFSNVRYTIIPEQGVSVYSCSEEALEEYPNFKPEIVSSLSLVKRFFNPLYEYVKVNPKNLGVGMYQHDINEKQLTEALEETVSEIVSAVGVDLNTASVSLLKSIAGLTESRAKAIIAYRNENGAFRNRKELLNVKGIGAKTFQQCAGFVRIIPPNDRSHLADYNLLDQTIIHPENYKATLKLLKIIGITLNGIGTPEFISKVKAFIEQANFVEVSTELSTDVDTTRLLFHALSTSLNHDIRTLADPPDFKCRMCSIDQLRQGMIVSGRVDNVTTFGAFVDIGVGVSGLLYFNAYNPSVGLGDRIEVIIDKLEVNRERIGLSFKRKIADLFPMDKLI